MSLNEQEPIDEAVLKLLLAADEALAAGVEPRTDASGGATQRLADEGTELAGLVGLIRRLGHPLAATVEPSRSPVDTQLPLRLGRFTIEAILGQGGYGIVYLARDPTLGRHVALKVPRPESLMNEVARRRFLREGRAAAGLDHPNLVAVHEAGEAGPLCYIASAYCPGPTLAAWLRKQTGPVRPELAARLIAALSDAVQHAHDRGILHRDIKPSNVILFEAPSALSRGGSVVRDRDLSPRLTDFGLARIADEEGEETMSGMPLGSPPYMAAEQAAGRNRDIGPATDTYALGATLYEVLTGRPPFRGESVTETLRMILETDCVAPRVLRPGLPRDLETICLTCLQKEPARRYASAGALGEDLHRFLRGEPIRARPTSRWIRAARWVRRRPLHAAALALTLVVTIGVIAGVLYRNVLLQGHAKALEREVVRADTNAMLARRHLQAFQLRQAKDALDANQSERAQEILASLQTDRVRASARQDPGDPGFAWHYLMRLARHDVVLLSDRQSERVKGLALSPDGKTLASNDKEGPVFLRDPQTGRVREKLLGNAFPIDEMRFSPDGTRLVAKGASDSSPDRRDEILVWDLAPPRLLCRMELPAGQHLAEARIDASGRRLWEVRDFVNSHREAGCWDIATDPAHPRLLGRKPSFLVNMPMSADGTAIAEPEQDRSLVVRDTATGKRLRRVGPLDLSHDHAALSADGRFLASGASAGKVHLWNVATGTLTAVLDAEPAPLYSLAFSPRGRYLLGEFHSGGIRLWDLSDGSLRLKPGGSSQLLQGYESAFSSDGRYYAFNGYSTLGKHDPIAIWELNTLKKVATYPGLPGSGPIAFASDHRSLFVTINNVLTRWDFAQRSETGQPAGHSDEAWSLAFSPDGQVLASGSDDSDEPQTIRLWDVATSGLIRGWSAGPGTVSALAFNPRGRLLASAHLDASGEVRLWDPGTGAKQGTLRGHNGFVRDVAFRPDGTLLASAGTDQKIRLWDVTTHQCTRVLSGHGDTVRHLAFHPRANVLASASNDLTIRLWDVQSGAPLHAFRTVEKVASVAFSPDGQSLAAADEKGTVVVWDLATRDRVQSIASENDYPLCLAYSLDGHSLAVAGKNQIIHLWDPLTGQQLLSLDGHKAQVNDLLFSPDGSVLASCSHDGAVRLWRSDAGSLDTAASRYGAPWNPIAPPAPRQMAEADRVPWRGARTSP